jgi:crotonobetainyl-CoA:carnitine CoA-transferase CaiB-like acyl-CoA transferase
MSDTEMLPLAGLKVVEFTHMVMGPSAGLILGDMGAEVIRVEPIGGDRTRKLLGSGAGYYPMYNRNKQSVCLDLKSAEGLVAARVLAANADIIVENFRPGTLERLGLGYEALSAENRRLIYCSAKGFLAGPYENRTALDEVAQMMGGLAYMTGPPGRPLRAGASVIDVTGGMFGVIGIMALVERRHRTGKGGQVKCSLYETTAFLVGQHMAQKAVTGKSAAPMPVRISAWAIYDVFACAGEGQLFVGVVSDQQWQAFCAGFGLDELGADQSIALNNDRVLARDRILPVIRAMFAEMDADALLARCEAIGLPVAKIARPEDLFDDAHLNTGGLVDVVLPDGTPTKLPGLPLEVDGARFGVHHDLGMAGADTRAILLGAGMTPSVVDAMFASGAAA